MKKTRLSESFDLRIVQNCITVLGELRRLGVAPEHYEDELVRDAAVRRQQMKVRTVKSDRGKHCPDCSAMMVDRRIDGVALRFCMKCRYSEVAE